MQTFHLFCTKKLLFLFYTLIFIKHLHQSIYSTYLFNKIFIFFYNFLLFPYSLPLSLTNPTLPKNTKILNARAIITMHICMIIVALVYLYTILYPLMWVFFLKMCKIDYYFFIFCKIMHDVYGCSNMCSN